MDNVLYSDVESMRRTRIVGNDVAPNTPIIDGGRPAVTVTGSGDYDGNAIVVTGNGESITIAGGRGGETLDDDEATVTYTGSYYFDVVGASAATTQNDVVYYDAAAKGLTLTKSGNTKFGIVEFHRGELSATDTAVTIGVNLG